MQNIKTNFQPNPAEIRANVYKMLEEHGIDTGSSSTSLKIIPQKTEQTKPEIKIKKISTPASRQSSINQLKEVYK